VNDSILEVKDLVVDYPSKGWRKPPHRVLKSVTIDIRHAETVGLVGESGSGKSTLGRAVLGLAPVSGGSIVYKGQEIGSLRRSERRKRCGDIQVVFQDPYSSLNPSLTIETILTEPLLGRNVSGAAARRRIAELLDQVRLPADSGKRLPREFSGGQRQRIAIARALALEPRLIVCDEPVSALDKTTEATVLELFEQIQEETGVSYLFISHDLAVIRRLSHRVAVLWQGEIVEWGDGDTVTSSPEHEYTRKLLRAAPVPDPDRQRQRRAEGVAFRAAHT